MSRSFAGVPFFNYRNSSIPGGFLIQDTNLCVPTSLPSRIVSLFIAWSVFATVPDVGVEVLLPSTISDKLGKIGSLYIDNTNSTVPVYIVFPDTNFVITAPPFTAVWYPVFTNAFRFQAICVGMVSGFIPQTRIFISNREIGPSSDPEIQKVFPQLVGTTSAQFGAANSITPGFGAPALGDRTATQQSAFTTALTASAFTVTDVSLLTGFLYITALDISFDVFGGVISTAGATLSMGFQFADSIGNTFLKGAVAARDTTAAPISLNVNVVRLQNLNLRYPAPNGSALISVNTDAPVVSAGTITSVRWRCTVNMVYSNNPN